MKYHNISPRWTFADTRYFKVTSLKVRMPSSTYSAMQTKVLPLRAKIHESVVHWIPKALSRTKLTKLASNHTDPLLCKFRLIKSPSFCGNYVWTSSLILSLKKALYPCHVGKSRVRVDHVKLRTPWLNLCLYSCCLSKLLYKQHVLYSVVSIYLRSSCKRSKAERGALWA